MNRMKGELKVSKNLYDAHKQWASRPPDERFGDLNELLTFTGNRKCGSIEDLRTLRDTRVYASLGGALNLNGRLPHAMLTNWSFGQLCRNISAPAGYLRTLSAEVASQCLEYGLRNSGEECKILTRRESIAKGSEGANLAAAFTSPNYGRIWDFDILSEISRAIEGLNWHPPSSYDDTKCGLYASDRDMFVFMVNDEEPIEVENTRLSRGFFCWNSETGSATFGLTAFLYNHVCGNHIVWGTEQVEELKIIHRSRSLNRFYQEAIPMLNRFVENQVNKELVENMVIKAMHQQLGSSVEEILVRFKTLPFCRAEIESAWNSSLAEGDDPTTAWGMVQGLTSNARGLKFADKRVDLERRAGALLNQN